MNAVNCIKNQILVIFLLLLRFQPCYGDGVFVWNKGFDLYEPSQKAIILYDEGVEDLILQVKYKGEASDFAWVLPLPNKPEVEAVHGNIFEEISLYTQLQSRWDVFFHRRSVYNETIDVLERQKVSVYDIAVLKANDAQELIKWLNENGFAIHNKAQQILRDYIKRKWTFVALRIHPDEEKLWVEKSLNEGTLVPLKFTFSSKECVYPLKISSLNEGETEVLLYVFYKDAVVHTDFQIQAPMALEFYRYSMNEKVVSRSDYFDIERWKKDRDKFSNYFDFNHKFFRPVEKSELPLCREVLPRLNQKKFFLSKLRNTYVTKQIQDDIILEPIEKLSKTKRDSFINRNVEYKHSDQNDFKSLHFGNSLLLRIKEDAIEYIANELERQTTEKISWYRVFEFLLHHPSKKALKILNIAASHENKQIRENLMQALYREGRIYGLNKKFVPIIKTLCEEAFENNYAFEALRFVGNDEALKVLSKYALQPDYNWKRRSALGNLSKMKKNRLINVYKNAIDNNSLTEDEIFFCLKGLELIDNPKAYTIVETAMKHYPESSRNSDLAKKLMDKWRK